MRIITAREKDRNKQPMKKAEVKVASAFFMSFRLQGQAGFLSGIIFQLTGSSVSMHTLV